MKPRKAGDFYSMPRRPIHKKEIEMIIDGNASGSLLEQFKSALATEGVAIKTLHDAMKSGIKDTEILLALTDRMTEEHNKKMDIWDQLQQHRLDK